MPTRRDNTAGCDEASAPVGRRPRDVVSPSPPRRDSSPPRYTKFPQSGSRFPSERQTPRAFPVGTPGGAIRTARPEQGRTLRVAVARRGPVTVCDPEIVAFGGGRARAYAAAVGVAGRNAWGKGGHRSRPWLA